MNIEEYREHRKLQNPHLTTQNIDKNVHAIAMRKRGKIKELALEKSKERHLSKNYKIKK